MCSCWSLLVAARAPCLFCTGLALDTLRQVLFICDQGGPSNVFRANYDGSNCESLYTDGSIYPIDATVDAEADRLFYILSNSAVVRFCVPLHPAALCSLSLYPLPLRTCTRSRQEPRWRPSMRSPHQPGCAWTPCSSGCLWSYSLLMRMMLAVPSPA